MNLLGNLTLVDKRINSVAGNNGLAEKLDILDKSELPVTKALVSEMRASAKTWGQAEIRERQARLADLAYDSVWRIS